MHATANKPNLYFFMLTICSVLCFDRPTTMGQTTETGLVDSALNQPMIADWPQWRGSADSGSVEGNDYPESLAPEDILWKTKLSGKGCSTPIVLNKKIYLTTPNEDQDSLACFDSAGKKLWQTNLGQQNAGKHRNGSGSNASPVTDGKAIFTYFKSGTLAAFELDGSVRWQKNLSKIYGKAELFWDHGTSPVLTQTGVVMARMHAGDSWVATFDKTDGHEVWKVDRNFQTPREGDHGYSTPLVIERSGQQRLLVYGAEQLTMHDAADGNMIWSCGNFNPDKQKLWPTVASPVVVGDVAIVAAGRNDRQIPLLYGVRLQGSGDVTAGGHLWKRTDTGTFVPTPAIWKNQVYLLRDRGQVECIDPETGNKIWEGQFPKHRKRFYASPLIAGGKLYAIREDGMMYVADISNDRLVVLSSQALQESAIGSPIPLGNDILVRGEKHLFCFGSPSP